MLGERHSRKTTRDEDTGSSAAVDVDVGLLPAHKKQARAVVDVLHDGEVAASVTPTAGAGLECTTFNVRAMPTKTESEQAIMEQFATRLGKCVLDSHDGHRQLYRIRQYMLTAGVQRRAELQDAALKASVVAIIADVALNPAVNARTVSTASLTLAPLIRGNQASCEAVQRTHDFVAGAACILRRGIASMRAALASSCGQASASIVAPAPPAPNMKHCADGVPLLGEKSCRGLLDVTAACYFMWTVSLIAERSGDLQQRLVNNVEVMGAVCEYLDCSIDEAQTSAAWFVSHVVSNSSRQEKLTVELDVGAILLRNLRRDMSSLSSSCQGMLTWALAILAQNNAAIQVCAPHSCTPLQHADRPCKAGVVCDVATYVCCVQTTFIEARVMDVLADVLLMPNVVTNTSAAVAFALHALGLNHPGGRQALRDAHGGDLLQHIVKLLDCDDIRVQQRVIRLLRIAVTDHEDNRKHIVQLGAGRQLASMLHAYASAQPLEMQLELAGVLLLLLSAALNWKDIVPMKHVIATIAGMLRSPSDGLRQLAATMTRHMARISMSAQLQFAALGAVTALTNMLTSTSLGVQEEAACALSALMLDEDTVCSLALVSDSAAVLLEIVMHGTGCAGGVEAAALVKATASSPTHTAQVYALNALAQLTVHDATGQMRHRLHDTPHLLRRLVWMSDAAFPDKYIQYHADQLLKVVATAAEYRARKKHAAKSLLEMLPTVTRTDSEDVMCCICMDSPECRRGIAGRSARARASQDLGVYTPCFHYFHSTCLTSWLNRGKDACPMCQVAVVGSIHGLLFVDRPAPVYPV